jgi:hypothetical protein
MEIRKRCARPDTYTNGEHPNRKLPTFYKLASGYAVQNPDWPVTLPRSEGNACHGQRIGTGKFRNPFQREKLHLTITYLTV